MRLQTFLPTALLSLLLFSCHNKEKADLLLYNATVYTVDSAFSQAEAMAIQNGKILGTGTEQALRQQYDFTEETDANGGYVFPGFIDAHAHFVGYAMGLQTADLTGTKSWEEVLQRLQTFAADHQEGWLIGRGWDQNDWEEKDFPNNQQLNELFPDRPVLLERVDGHASVANGKALEMAGITSGRQVPGGDVVEENGTPTGLLIDNAVNLVSGIVPPPTKTQFKDALLQAEKNCFAVGLTTIDDCGLNLEEVEKILQLQSNNFLRMRLYVLLSDATKNYEYLEKNGIIKTDRLHVRGFKVYGDGALGSRGACLLQPYRDRENHYGFLLSAPEHFDSVAARVIDKGFQLCTHAIGDSGNRTILNTYAKYLKPGNDLRWRIEHAQVVNQQDFNLFGRFNIIPSVQPTHATSDMYWAGERLGRERLAGAYAYKQLLSQNEWMPLGTDFPVEDISPFKTFFAATVRKDARGWPENGFQMENAISREEAIRGMTIWAARSNFEENEKGSLEKGKLADFILLDKDLMNMKEEDILSTKVIKTYVGGELVYERKGN